MLKKVSAFIKKDFLEEVNYPATFLYKIVLSCIVIIELYLLGMLFSKQASPYLSRYGGDYFTFAIIGTTFANFFLNCMQVFPDTIVSAQSRGTFEMLLSTPIKPYKLMLLASIWPFLNAAFQLVSFILISYYILKCNISWVNIASAAIVFLIALVCFFSLGLISASACLAFKRQISVRGLIMSIGLFFGGVYFPITLFPEWLQKVSLALPLTHALNILRDILINRCSIRDLKIEVLILTFFSLTAFFLGLLLFRMAMAKLRRDGSATYY